MTHIAAFFRNRSGAAAAEFALVLPVALLLFFGIIDVGRYVWAINEVEKSVQMGTRYAVATSVVPTGLKTMNFIGLNCGTKTLAAGDTICKNALGTISCTKSGTAVSCACAPSPLGSASCPGSTAGDATAFQKIVQRMRVVAPFVREGNVKIKYSGSGIGYAGDPAKDDSGGDLSDVSPVVTVEVESLTLRMMLLLGGAVPLPSLSYSQTLEDGDGSVAY